MSAYATAYVRACEIVSSSLTLPPTLPCTVSAECLKGKGLTSGAAAGLLAHKFGGVDEADVGPTIEQLF